MLRLRTLLFLAAVTASGANKQLRAQTTLDAIVSAPRGTPTIPVRYGYINLNTGNLHLEIPITATPQRGMGPQSETIVYNSGGFWFNNPAVISPPPGGYVSYWQFQDSLGLPSNGPVIPVNVDYSSCGSGWYGEIETYSFWQFIDAAGTTHIFHLNSTNTQNCASATGTPEYPNGYGNLTASGPAEDGSGYYLSVTNGDTAIAYSPDGSTYQETPNGNKLNYSTDANFSAKSCNKTWGSYAQPYAATSAATCQYTYHALNGSSASNSIFTVVWEYVPVCTGYYVHESAPVNSYDFCGGIWALESITLPDGLSTYSFQYDTGTAPGHYGQMTAMVLPTGGTVRYSYNPPTGNGITGPSDGRGDIASITDNGGTTSFSRTFTSSSNLYGLAAAQFTTATINYPPHIVDPLHPSTLASDQTVFTAAQSQAVGSVPPNTMLRQDYLNGVLTKTSSWDTTTPGTPSFDQVTWNQTGVTDKIQYAYATGDVVSRADEYINGSLYRSKAVSYQQDTASIKYVSQYHMVNYPVLTQILNASGQVIAQESRTYDEYGAAYCNSTPPGTSTIPMLTNITGALAHDDTDNGINYWARGNPTTITQGTSISAVTSHNCYDTLGNVTESVDGNSNPTAFSHSDNYSDNLCLSSGSSTYALLTTVTDPLGHQTKSAYDSCTGAATQIQDSNDLSAHRSGTQQTFDLDGHPLCTTYADGGSTCTYWSANSILQTMLLSPSQSHSTVTTLDSFGNPTSIVDNGSNSETDKTYDAFGRVSTISNAYTVGATGAHPVTTYAYDGFGRLLAQLQADGTSEMVWSYTGTTVDAYDESNVHRRTQNDVMGRLASTFELGTASAPLNYETDYSYDVLNNLIEVDQWGGPKLTAAERQRTFTYDSLSRLICASNPENSYSACPSVEPASGTSGLPAGTLRYTYDNYGNVYTKVDARGITVNYSYDKLNRMLTKSSSDGTINYKFVYDGSDGNNETNPLGRMTFASNQVNAAQTYFYDPVGRISKSTYCVPQDPKCDIAVSAVYDLAGDLTSLTYPDSRIVSQSYNAGGQLLTVNYANWGTTAINNNYLNVPGANGYDAAGHLVNATMGNGIQISSAYNSRETIGSLGYSQGSTKLWSKQYTWYPNENLQLITDAISGVQREFTYDNLNRLRTAQDLAGTSGASGEAVATSEESEQSALVAGNEIWGSATATVTPNATAAPDGTETATAISVTSGTADNWSQALVVNPPLYSGASFSGSVWLKVPSGSLSTYIYIVEIGNQGIWSVAGQTAVTLMTTWQKFTVAGTLQNGLTALAFQLGGSHSITGGAVYDVWGGELGPAAAGSTTNILPSSQQLTSPSWFIINGALTGTMVTAPDGTNTAQTLASSSGSTDTYAVDEVQNPSQYSSDVVTASVYLRVPNGTQNIDLFIVNHNAAGASVVGQAAVTLNTSWQRFSVTATNEAGLTEARLQIGGGGTVTSGQSFNFWGAQMVVGSTPGSYVETQNTTTVTGTSQTLAAAGLNEAYSYDAFGNIQENGTWNFVQGYTPSNQISGWSYDQAGNVLVDGLGTSYAYDGESKLKSAGGVNYVYTAEGDRVEKSSPLTDTVYFGGRPLARLSGGAWTDLIYGASGLLAEVPGTQSGTPVYRMTDHLGSLVGTLSSSGATLSSQDLGPFGEVFAGGSSDGFVFTGKERDVESGNDYFGARYYGSSMGRFLSPDPSGLAYANYYNPQSLNLYSYALNNPLTNIDPTGLDCVYFDDDGEAAESIDHSSNSGECGQNGGDWVNGTTYSNWISPAANGTFNIGSTDSNNTYWSNVYSPGTQSDGTTCSGDCSSVNGYSQVANSSLLPQLGGNINTQSQMLSWAVTQTTPVGWFQKFIIAGGNTNWCGEGGMGTPANGHDWNCMVHDYQYKINGYNAASNGNWNGNASALQNINQTLCNGASSQGGYEGFAINAYFTVAPFLRGNGGGTGACH